MNFMTYMYMYMFLMIFFSGIVVFCSVRKHLLLTLLSLEYLVSSLFIFFILFLNSFTMENYLLLLFLTFSVCEGVVGLSILVSLIRIHGNDMISSIIYLVW